MNEKIKNFMSKATKVGTMECALFCAAVALLAALLILLAGFWQTVLVAVIVALGVFIGGVKDKKEWLSAIVNKVFPPKTEVPYKAENVNINVTAEKKAETAEEPKTEEENAD